MDLGIRGKVALVTGASIGIGQGIARVLAAEGVRVAITARRGELLAAVADEIAATGAERPLVIAADLTDPGAPRQLLDQVVATYGRLDILVNNAGGSMAATLESPDEYWAHGWALNVDAVRRLAHAAVPLMQQHGWGRIITITGTHEPAGLNAASGAKAAVTAWSKGLSRAVARSGITVNCVGPGRIDSEQTRLRLLPDPEQRQQFAERSIPVGYIGTPEDVAYAVAFLSSTLARYVTGESIMVDGGMRRTPF